MRLQENKKYIILGSLCALIVTMTVAYAAFQTNLKVKGTTNISSNWDVRITNVVETNKNGEAETVGTPTWTELTANIEANLYEKGDYIEYDVTVENNGSLDASLENIKDELVNNNEAIKISFSGYTKGEKLYKNTSQKITVRIEYNPEFTGNPEEGSTEINLDLNYEQAEGGTINPADKYLITYDANGGKTNASNEYLEEGANVNLNYTAEKEDYIFIGWNTDKESKEALKEYKMPSQEMTLYAIYVTPEPPIIDNVNTRSTSNSITAVVSAHDNYGKIIKYEYSLDGENYQESINNEYTFTGLKSGTYYPIYVRVTNEYGLTTKYNAQTQVNTELNYTGSEQVFIAPKLGLYKLEVWGASGGYAYDSNRTTGDGGYGAYAVGTLQLKANENLYVVIGGEGQSNCQTSSCAGGYNGGSESTKWASGDGTGLYTAGGGGATHIAGIKGLLSELENSKDKVYIVAAGGGGGDYYGGFGRSATGGNGGGITGGNSKASETGAIFSSTGGTQTKGYAFGKAGTLNKKDSVGGSGGGYYGGSSPNSNHSTGAGGSSYIGNQLLTDKVMYCYNCEESSAESTKTISTTNVSASPISNYAKKGNGAAKITLLNTGETTKVDVPIFEEKETDAGKEVTITYPEGCGSKYTCTYKKDSEDEVIVTEVSANVEFKKSGSLVATINTNTDKVSSSYTVVLPQLPLGTTDFKTENCTATTGDGLYKDSYENGRCVYKGTNPNNYIKYNDELWRIVSVETDGVLKIMKNESIDQLAWDSNSSKSWAGASLKTYLNETYYNTLTESAQSIINNHTWYVGEVYYNSERTDFNSSITREKSATWTGKIGLIGLTDYIKANSSSSCGTIEGYSSSKCDETNYISTMITDVAWLITPVKDFSSSDIWGNNAWNTKMAFMGTTWKYEILPTVYLNSNITLSGKGTAINPYKINDSEETIETKSVNYTKTTSSITVVVTTTNDDEVSKYEYSKDGGKTWEEADSNIYMFDNLIEETSYNIVVRVTSKSGQQDSESLKLTTNALETPTFEAIETDTEKEVTIIYPEGCGDNLTCSYQKDEGDWTETTDTNTKIIFTESGNVVAKVTDGTNEQTASHTVIYEGNQLDYNGEVQTFTADNDGYYKIELWGAQGGSQDNTGGKGAYTSGEIYLNKGQKLYVYIGSQGLKTDTPSFNGGGAGASVTTTGYGGGGATDVRLINGEWDDLTSLGSRIMVAAGGSGLTRTESGSAAGDGGTLIGFNGKAHSSVGDTYIGNGATQTSGGTVSTNGGLAGQFGMGGSGTAHTDNHVGGGGGGGYYGGSGARWHAGGGGGSSYISGYAGVNSITSESDRTHTNQTKHYSDKYFINTEMKAGVNSGDGKAKITYLKTPSSKDSTKIKGVRYIKDCKNNISDVSGSTNLWIEIQAINKGINVAKGKNIISISNSTNGLELIVDGKMDDIGQRTGLENGIQCITVDLEKEYDLEEIAVWHYYGDSRTYKDSSIQVAGEDEKYRVIYNEDKAETSNGTRVRKDSTLTAKGKNINIGYTKGGAISLNRDKNNINITATPKSDFTYQGATLVCDDKTTKEISGKTFKLSDCEGDITVYPKWKRNDYVWNSNTYQYWHVYSYDVAKADLYYDSSAGQTRFGTDVTNSRNIYATNSVLDLTDYSKWVTNLHCYNGNTRLDNISSQSYHLWKSVTNSPASWNTQNHSQTLFTRDYLDISNYKGNYYLQIHWLVNGGVWWGAIIENYLMGTTYSYENPF